MHIGNLHASIRVIITSYIYFLVVSYMVWGRASLLYIYSMHNDAIILSASTCSLRLKNLSIPHFPPKAPNFFGFGVFYPSSLAELFVVIHHSSYLLLLLLLLFTVSFITGRWQYLKHSWQLALAVTWLQPDIATSPTTSPIFSLGADYLRLTTLDGR